MIVNSFYIFYNIVCYTTDTIVKIRIICITYNGYALCQFRVKNQIRISGIQLLDNVLVIDFIQFFFQTFFHQFFRCTLSHPGTMSLTCFIHIAFSFFFFSSCHTLQFRICVKVKSFWLNMVGIANCKLSIAVGCGFYGEIRDFFIRVRTLII